VVTAVIDVDADAVEVVTAAVVDPVVVLPTVFPPGPRIDLIEDNIQL